MNHPPDPSSSRNRAGWIFMAVGMFMAILDIQIVASSLGEIQGALSAAPDEIAWIQTSYLVAEVIMIPLSGFLARLLSTRVLFTVACSGFTLASIGCATADTLSTVIVWRAIQGFLGGGMIPTVFATAFRVFKSNEQAKMSAILGVIATLAPTIGPSLGGWLTTTFSWHWLYLVNVVPGVIVSLGVWTLVDVDRPRPELLQGFDYLGLLGLAAFLGALEVVLDEGPDNDWLADPLVRDMAIVTLCGAVLFFWRALSHYNPIVDLRSFLDRNFTVGCCFSFVLGIGLYGSTFVLPLFLARVRGYNAYDIGIAMTVTGIVQLFTAPIAARLSKVLEPRLMLAIGFGLFALGMFMNAGLTADTGVRELALPQALRGMSLLFCFIPINRLALGTLPPEQLNNASGLYNLMRNLGGAVGIALITTILQERDHLHWSRLAESIDMSRPEVRAALDSLAARFGDMLPSDAQQAAIGHLARLVQRESLVLTFNDTFVLLSVLFVIALVCVPMIRKPRGMPGADAEAH